MHTECKMGFSNGPVSSSSSQEIVEAQTHIWNHIYSFINSMSLKCALQLAIPDAIHTHGQPMTLSQLADALPVPGAKSHGLYRLMRVLVHSKFFDLVTVSEDGEKKEAYSLTPASRLLLRDGPMSIRPFALTALDPVVMDPFQHLSEWLQNDLPTPFFTKNGRNPWEFAESDRRWNRMYNEAVASDARLVAGILVKECRGVFEGLRTMVDVGGGTGMVAKAVADAFPGLKCTVLELPRVVDGLEGSENLRYVTGDMMEFIPRADAVFLKWNLSMWSNDVALKLLGKCKEAINDSNNGKVIIVEMIVGNHEEDHKATETQYFLDMHMLAKFSGGERTEKEWEKLFFAAGFKSYKITPALGLRSVIEVFP